MAMPHPRCLGFMVIRQRYGDFRNLFRLKRLCEQGRHPTEPLDHEFRIRSDNEHLGVERSRKLKRNEGAHSGRQ